MTVCVPSLLRWRPSNQAAHGCRGDPRCGSRNGRAVLRRSCPRRPWREASARTRCRRSRGPCRSGAWGGHIRGARRVDRGAGEPERGHNCPFPGCTSRSPRTLRTVPRLGVTRRCLCGWNLAQRRQARTCRDGTRHSRPGWGGRPARRSYNGLTQRGHGRQQERDGGRSGMTAAPAAAPAGQSSRSTMGSPGGEAGCRWLC
jgi:hypothetical protein